MSQAYDMKFECVQEGWCHRPNYIQVYLPSRCGIVYRPLLE